MRNTNLRNMSANHLYERICLYLTYLTLLNQFIHALLQSLEELEGSRRILPVGHSVHILQAVLGPLVRVLLVVGNPSAAASSPTMSTAAAVAVSSVAVAVTSIPPAAPGTGLV